jgi:Ras family protein A
MTTQTEAGVKPGGSAASTTSSSTLVHFGAQDEFPESLDLSKLTEKQHDMSNVNVPFAESGMIRRKLVVVGDSAVGKSALLVRFVKGTSLETDVPTVFEQYDAEVLVDGAQFELTLWDTGGMDAYDKLRPLSYPDSHLVLICFAIGSPDSLDNVHEKWISEVRHFCRGLPIILVGTKMDLRDDPHEISELLKSDRHPVTPSEGEKAGKKIRALKYLECSAKTNEGVREIFEVAARATWHAQVRKGKRRYKFRSLFSSPTSS